jgi:hypothetical protein
MPLFGRCLFLLEYEEPILFPPLATPNQCKPNPNTQQLKEKVKEEGVKWERSRSKSTRKKKRIENPLKGRHGVLAMCTANAKCEICRTLSRPRKENSKLHLS